MSNSPDSFRSGIHRELEKAEIAKSEDAVQRVMQTFTSCFMNPWCVPDKSRLYNIASGAPVTPEVEVDVLRADALGKEMKNRFIKERLQSKDPVSFFDKLPRLKLRRMADTNKKVKLTSSQDKVKSQFVGNRLFDQI